MLSQLTQLSLHTLFLYSCILVLFLYIITLYIHHLITQCITTPHKPTATPTPMHHEQQPSMMKHHPAAPDHGNHHGSPGSGSGPMCSMDMTFNWNTENVCVVFKSWRISSYTQLFLSALFIFCFSYGAEYLKYYVGVLNQRLTGSLTRRTRIQASLWYGLQYTISILLMLIYMTYNGYLIAAVLLGGMLGHFHWSQSPAIQLPPCH